MEKLNFGNLCKEIYSVVENQPIWTLPELAKENFSFAERATQKSVVILLYSTLWDDKQLWNVPCPSAPTASALFNCNRNITLKVRKAAVDADISLIRENVQKRFFEYLDEEQIRTFLSKLRPLIKSLPESHTLRMREFSDKLSAIDPQKPDSMLIAYEITAYCIYFCLNVPNTNKGGGNDINTAYLPAVPQNVQEHYDPYNYSDRKHQSKAITIELIDTSGENKVKKFHILELAREYILNHAIVITKIACTPRVITLQYHSGKAMGYRLTRIEGHAECQRAHDFINDYLKEFKPKLSWRPRTLAEMALNGLEGPEEERENEDGEALPKWIGYAYYDQNGEIAAYLDYKLRCDGDIELGIQLTAADHRHRHLATGLINFVRLSFASYHLYAGTYEENKFMRQALDGCGFIPNYFYDKRLNIRTNKIRERENANGLLSNSVYYQAFSLLSQMRVQRDEESGKMKQNA